MTDASDSKRDFFVSYNKADLPWAEWIGSTLEAGGFSVLLAEWDAKGNFVTFMEEAHRRTERTVALLSDNYHGSDFTAGEWTARYARDAAGRKDTLIPVIVGPISQPSLLDALIFADLFACGRDEEKARKLFLERIARATDPEFAQKKRAQPHAFPGGLGDAAAPKPRFPVPIHNLPPFNPDFVGREQVLADLHQRLTSGRGPTVLSQAISGLGGVGKTQTALTYCHRHLADYQLIWWLRAETAATLAADYGALAEPLGLDLAAADQDKLIAGIRAALQTRAGWLLVFDNVEDPVLPRAFLPTTGQGHVLITSRRTDWHGIATPLPLEVMPAGEALQLLTSRPDPDTLPAAERTEAEALAAELGYLPLALAQARAYMTEAGRNFAGYRRLLQTSRPTVLDRGRPSPDYPASVARTWQISIDAAAGTCAAARPLLELLAFFAPEALPVAVLGAAPAALSDGLTDELARDDAIAALHRFSLIRAAAGTLTVHRLVQVVTRDGLDAATARAQAEAAVELVNAALPRPPQEHTNWPAIGTLLPHALAAAEAAERLEAGLETAGTVLNETALYHSYHRARAAYAEAEPLFQRAIAIGEKTLGPKHPNLAARLNNLAVLYQDIGRYAEAEPLYQRAIAIGEKTLGPEHPKPASGLNNLAELYRVTRRYAEAEPLYQRAIAIGEKILGPEHPDLAIWLNNLANHYQHTGRYAEAELLYQRAIAIGEKALGPGHPNLAIWLNNLANHYQHTGRYAEAEPLYQRAIAIDEKTLPPEHPNLMGARENYAGLLDKLGRPAEAAALRAPARASR